MLVALTFSKGEVVLLVLQVLLLLLPSPVLSIELGAPCIRVISIFVRKWGLRFWPLIILKLRALGDIGSLRLLRDFYEALLLEGAVVDDAFALFLLLLAGKLLIWLVVYLD